MFNSKNLKNVFFLATLITLMIGFIYILSPYLGIIFLSLILVEIFHPWYEFLKTKLKSENLASLIAGISIILTVVVPISIILVIVVFQASTLLNRAESFWNEHDIISQYSNTLDRINKLIASVSTNPDNQITTGEVTNFVTNLSQSFLATIVDSLRSTVSKTLTLITQISMLLISIFSLFRLRNKIYSAITELSPLDNEIDQIFIKNFIQTANSVIKGTFLVAITLGIVGGFTFWVLQIEAPVFWGMMMTLFSIIPIGSGIIWIPASIYLFASGEILKAIVLFAVGLIMTNVIDTMLRSRLTNKKANLNSLLLAFSILGGLEVFGVLGFLYGPLITVLFITLMRIYQTKFAGESA